MSDIIPSRQTWTHAHSNLVNPGHCPNERPLCVFCMNVDVASRQYVETAGRASWWSRLVCFCRPGWNLNTSWRDWPEWRWIQGCQSTTTAGWWTWQGSAYCNDSRKAMACHKPWAPWEQPRELLDWSIVVDNSGTLCQLRNVLCDLVEFIHVSVEPTDDCFPAELLCNYNFQSALLASLSVMMFSKWWPWLAVALQLAVKHALV